MNMRSRILVGLCLATALAFPALADLTYTQGSGTTIFDFTCFTTKHCSAHVPITSAGVEAFTVGSPGQVTVTNTNANGQAVMASSSPVVIASNQSAVPSSIDPCNDALTVKSFLPITATTSLVKVIATGTAAKKLYICQINLVTTAANNVAVFEATTATTCATAAVAVYGAGTSVATAANGYPFAANGGISLGNGLGTVGSTTVNNNDLCIGTSAATPLTGGIIYATK